MSAIDAMVCSGLWQRTISLFVCYKFFGYLVCFMRLSMAVGIPKMFGKELCNATPASPQSSSSQGIPHNLCSFDNQMRR